MAWAAEERTRVCPDCAERLEPGELVCRHCGSLVTELGEEAEAVLPLSAVEEPEPEGQVRREALPRATLAAAGALLALALLGGGTAAYLAYDQGKEIDRLREETVPSGASTTS